MSPIIKMPVIAAFFAVLDTLTFGALAFWGLGFAWGIG